MNILERFWSFVGVDVGGNTQVMTGDQEPTHVYDQIQAELKSDSEFYNYVQSREGRYAISALFESVALEKAKIVDMVDSYKDTFFHQMIVNMLFDDVLNVDPVTNNVVDITTTNEYLKPIIEHLQEKLDIDSFISSIAEDVIAYGDYIVRVVTDGNEVLSLEDDVDQKKVVVLYKASKPVFAVDTSSGTEEKIDEYVKFLHFSVNPRKLKIKINANALGKVSGGTPWSEYVRIGKPLFWGVWDLLNSLYVLTVFYPVFAVQKLNATTVIGVKVPPETPQERAWQVAKKYQELFNVYSAVDKMGRVSLADVIDTVGRYKVVPVWGDEKGVTQLADPRLDESFALDVMGDLKKTLCATLGVPYSFLFGSDENTSKLDVLKSFSRYVKRIGSVQRAIRDGLMQLVNIECRLKNVSFVPSDIDIRFRNSVIGVEQLDKLDFMDGMLGVVQTAVDTVGSLASGVGGKVNNTKLLDFVDSYLGMVGLDGVIIGEQEVSDGDDLASSDRKPEWDAEDEDELFADEEQDMFGDTKAPEGSKNARGGSQGSASGNPTGNEEEGEQGGEEGEV